MIPFRYVALESITSTGAGSSTPIYTPLAVLTGPPAYALVSYSPTIAGRRSGRLSGGGAYAEVEDTITLHVLGDSADRCVANYEALLAILDQGADWWAGANVPAVRLAVEVQGSTTGRLGAIIHGAAPGSPPAVAAPEPDVPGSGCAWIIRNVQVRVIRRAEWLADSRVSASDTTASNPEIATRTFADDQSRVVAPAAVTIINTSPGALVTADGYLAVTADAAALQLISAPALAAAGFAAQNDAANLPFQGTNVLRYTPASTAFAATAPSVLSTSGYRTWVALVALRNNSASIGFQVRVRFDQEGGSAISTVVQTVRSRAAIVDTSSQQPRYIVLGPVSVRAGGCAVSLEVAADSTTGPPTLDLSHVALVALDGPAAHVVRLPALSANADGRVIVTHRDLLYAARAPLATIDALLVDEDQLFGIPYEGDAAIGAVGLSVSTLYLQTEGARWVVDTAAGAKAPLTVAVARRRAYLAPQ